jgi:hypothetical protein
MTTRHYVHLGKLLCAEFPEIALQLSKQIDEETPVFSDLTLLPVLLEFFCVQYGIQCDMVKGKEVGRLSLKTKNKHLFIALVVKLYSPSTLGPRKDILMSKLRQELSLILITRSDRISRIISNVRIYLKAYKDFVKEVDQHYTLIIQNTDELKESNKS